MAEKYPTWGPYVFSGNRVIDARELEGLEPHVLFNKKENAVKNYGQQYNGRSILKGSEYGANVYSVIRNGQKQYAYDKPVKGDGHVSNLMMDMVLNIKLLKIKQNRN